jgi:catechol 2,3-dioxygenase-like lactoylglutathione lyase family enzyme
MFEEFGLVMVVVSDMADSVAFYRDVLGLKLMFETSEWSSFQVGHVMLGLHPQSPHLPVNPAGGISFGFYVKSLDDTLLKLAEYGVVPIRTSDEDFGRLAIIPDPDGYGIQLCQSKYGS